MRTMVRTLGAAPLFFALAALLAPLAASGGADEAIGISGHWVIEVRDPDGTPVMRREFHNALAGDHPITDLVMGLRTPGPLRVTFSCGGADGPGFCTRPCSTSNGGQARCVIYEQREQFDPNNLNPVPSAFNNLAVSSGDNGLQLRGFAVVSNDATIAFFETSLVTCPATVRSCVRQLPPPGLFIPSRASLTRTGLSPGVAVTAGQQVLVTITITAATAPPAPAPQSGASSR